jgi:hypothetical protein
LVSVRVAGSRALISAILTLSCQLLVLGAPIANSLAGARDEKPATECVCEQSGHVGAICPMHHSPAKKKSGSSDAQCRIGQTDTSLPSVALATGSLPEPSVQLTTPIERGLPIAVHTDRLLARSTSFDPPPPRS